MLRQFMRVVVIMGLIGIMSGCATLNEEECVTADWYEIGFSDGVKGEPESYFEKHRKACSKHGVGTNLSGWLAGREEGLTRYCTAAKGYDEGLNNRTYHGVCQGQAAREFEQAYQYGQELYQQRQVVSQIESDIENIDRELADLDREWDDLRAALLNENLNRYERTELVNRLDAVKNDNEDLTAERQYLIERLNQAVRVLEDMERRHNRQRYN